MGSTNDRYQRYRGYDMGNLGGGGGGAGGVGINTPGRAKSQIYHHNVVASSVSASKGAGRGTRKSRREEDVDIDIGLDHDHGSESSLVQGKLDGGITKTVSVSLHSQVYEREKEKDKRNVRVFPVKVPGDHKDKSWYRG